MLEADSMRVKMVYDVIWHLIVRKGQLEERE
jgi:hypothetical protein